MLFSLSQLSAPSNLTATRKLKYMALKVDAVGTAENPHDLVTFVRYATLSDANSDINRVEEFVSDDFSARDHDDLVAGTTYHYRACWTDTFGNVSALAPAVSATWKVVETGDITDGAVSSSKIASNAVDSSKILDGAIIAAKISDGVISAAKFASAVKPVEVFSALPSTGNVDGRMVFLTTDKKLYRYDAGAGAFTAAVPAADISGTLTDAQLSAISAAKITGQVVAAQIADAAISVAKFAAGLKPVEVLSALPSTGNTAGRMVFLTTDNKLYRYNGAAFVSTVPSTDLTGTLTDAQLAAISAAKITGQLVAAQIADAAITTAKFAAGLTPVEILAALPSSGNFQGRMVLLTTDNKLYRYNGSAFVASVPAADLTGTLTDAQLSAISATKITGQVVAAQIADAAITAAKFAAGLTPVEVVGTLPASGNFAGRMCFLTTDSKLYRYNGSAFVASVATTDLTGTLADAQLAAISASKITGQLTDAQLAAISAAKLTGTITTTQVTDDAITTAKIAAGAVTATEIAAGAIIAGKIAAGIITATEIAAATITGAKIAAGTIAAGNIAAGTITGDRLAANTITAAQIAADTITAGQIAAGAIGASEIAANAVTASKVFIGDTSNMVRDPDCVETILWSATSALTSSPHAVAGVASKNYLWLAATTALSQIWNGSDIPIEGGKPYYVSAYVGTNSGVSVTSTLRVNWYSMDAAGVLTFISNTDIGVYAGTSFGKVSDIVAAPATARRMQITIIKAASASAATNVLLEPIVRRASNGELIVDGAITAAKIQAGSITSNEIAAATIVSGDIAANTITGGNIAANTITAANIAADTITAGQIAAGAISSSELAAGAVIAGKIAAGIITATEIAATTITGAKIAADAITAAHILAATITSAEIAANTITGSNIAAGTITAANIAADTITAGQIAAGAISSSELAAGAVIAGKIAAGIITAAEIAAATITGAKIAADTITAAHILAGTITANEIAGSTITGAKIAADTITGANIAADTITSGEIAAGAISTSELAAGAIVASKIAVGTFSDNLVLDGDFESGLVDAWTKTNGTLTNIADTSAPGGGRALQLDRGTTGNTVSMNIVTNAFYPVEAGDTYYAEFTIKGSTASAAGAYLRILFYDASKAAINDPVTGVPYRDFYQNGAITTAYVTQKNSYVIPAGVKYVRVQVYHHSTSTAQSLFVSSVMLKRMITGDLIVSGTITASHISSYNLTAANATFGNVDISNANIGTLQVQTLNIANGAATDGKTDPTAPGTPGTPTLASITADIDKDGTLDTGLTAAWSAPGSGRAPKRYRIEIWRRKGDKGTDGNNVTGYTFWKNEFSNQLSHTFKANAQYFHKVRIFGITGNDVEGTGSAYTTVGVAPAGIAAGPADPTNVVATSLIFGVRITTDPSPDADYDHSEVYTSITSTPPTSTSTPSLTFVGMGVLLSVSAFGYYLWVRHVNHSGIPSNWVAYGAPTFTGPQLLDGLYISAGTIEASRLGSTAVSDKMAGAAVGAVGTYAFLKKISAGTATPGDLVSGANLAYSDTSLTTGSNPSGQWQCMGRCPQSQATNWLRVS